MKTGKEIQGDIFALLRDSELSAAVSGEVYRNGYRPRDSRKEDIIVTLTSCDAEQVQSGVVTINIYVPDTDPFNNGLLVEDGARCEQLEKVAAQWVESLTADKSNYLFRLQRAITTAEDWEIHQHFIVIALRFDYKD